MTAPFTKMRSMSFPREILAGHDAITKLGALCEKFELKGKALIVTGKKTNKIVGETVRQHLHDACYETETIILSEASRQNVDWCEETIRDKNISFLVAVGGGSKIDIAKLAAAELRIPFISVPTCASHDGIASPRASIKDCGKNFSVEGTMPLGIVADTSIIVKSPYRLLASGCADIIANATAIRDWELAVKLKQEPFSRTAYMMSKISADTIMGHAGEIKPNLEESVWIVIRQIISSGLAMGVAGSSRPTSGSEHLFSHALDMIAPGRALHGEQCGLGTIMMMSLQGGDWGRIRSALRTIGAPVNARQLGFSRQEIVKALTIAHTIRPDRYTILGDSGLGKDAAQKLASETGVI